MKKRKNKNTDYFDDCALCQMMKETEKKGEALSESELKIGFKKMKEKAQS